MTEIDKPVLGNERRSAFRRAFTLYPVVLRALCEQNVSLRAPSQALTNPTPGQVTFAMQVFAAQFAVRLLRSRIQFEKQNLPDSDILALEMFERQQIAAYEQFRDGLFPLHQIVTSKEHMAALDKIQQDMVSVIFEAFMTEANEDDFDEVAFWSDVFRGIGDNGFDGIQLMRGFTAGWLGNMEFFRAAVLADAARPPIGPENIPTHQATPPGIGIFSYASAAEMSKRRI